MKKTFAQTFITDLLKAVGIEVNGSHPWDIQVHHEGFFPAVLHHRNLGLGEAYMNHWWDCERVDLFFERCIRGNIHHKISADWLLTLKIILYLMINRQTKKRALKVGKKHYDLGNELFTAMLDKRMNYTCGYWKNATTLDAAQLAKLELVCQKLMLKPGMRLLDIGCGFGALAKHAAEHHGVDVVGITISKNQLEYAQKNCAGLPIELRFQDYRDINESFDRIASLGMFEHVGSKNHETYMQVAHRCLKDDGLFLLHTIGNNESELHTDPWIEKYIFPNGLIPSIAQIGKSIENLFVMEDWHNFGADYDKTLMVWHTHFNAHWHEIQHHYSDQFFRMWNYYLTSCAGVFRARYLQLWQIVLSKNGVAGGYQAPR